MCPEHIYQRTDLFRNGIYQEIGSLRIKKLSEQTYQEKNTAKTLPSQE
ncbi:MAG: hypothetical protein ACJA1Q_003259 [Pseudohongiellaceae bacterium]